MLGVHRPGVTIAVNALAADGLVRHGRNHLVIEDHPGLEQRSCECYGVLHAALLQLRSVFVG
jgi:hypothetical protein